MRMLWPTIILICAAFCIVRGVIDIRDRRFVLGALGIVAGIALLVMPIRTHAVKVDLLPVEKPE